MADAIKPTVFIIKQDVTDPDDIFKDASKLKKTRNRNVFLYYKDSVYHPPKWMPFVGAHFTIDASKFRNSSAYAVIVLKAAGRFFVIPFGMGSHLLNMAKIEYNFGLKVAINCIPKDEIRQMDLTTPETNSQKTKKQAVKNSTPEEFGVNKQKDILRGVVGRLPKKHALGDRIEGKDSVRIAKNIETMNQLKSLCKLLLTYSKSNEYKKHYPWIDNMAIINDPDMINSLYQDLIDAIKSNSFESMYISPPQFIDDLYEYEGFVFTGNRKRKENKKAYPFPTMENLVTDLGDECINSLDRENLRKSCKVFLRDTDEELCFGWPLNRCIAWETEKDGKKYILSEGHWYKIDDDFYEDVCKFFDCHVQNDLKLPEIPINMHKESDYNAHACDTIDDAYLFDLGHASAKDKHITKDKNEICDIFDADDRRFIHVKVGKSSPDISHLLRQGVFSGRALKLDQGALNQFKRYLVDYGCPANTIGSSYTPARYKIVFALMLEQNQKKDIPFFSKVSFRDAAELSLEIMGYDCQFGYIMKEAAANDTIDGDP